MPVRLNIGLSRKIGEANYSSRGASINMEMELDSSLLADPQRLHERIRQLFQLVRVSLMEELNGHQGSKAKATAKASGPAPRLATTLQVQAIKTLIERQQLDLPAMLQEHFQVQRLEELSIRQASEFIDVLKAARNGKGA